MSTKTLRKRIALVAVSALGFGLVSTVPAQAALTAPTTFTVSSGTVVAGAQAVDVTIAGAGAVLGLKITNPLGANTYWASAAVASGDGTVVLATSSTAVTYAGGVFTIPASQLLTPGTYQLTGTTGSSAEIDTAAEIDAALGSLKTSSILTVNSPATATTMGISMDASNYTGLSTTPVIRAWRPTNGVTGAIKLRWDRSPDSDLAAGTVAAGSNTGTSDTVNYFSNGDSDIAGTYSATAWVDTNGNGIVDGAEPSAAISYVVTSASSSGDLITVTT